MGLQLLEEVVHGQRGVAVVEPDDHADREHVVAHRVDERAAELAVLGRAAERPAHRVDDVVERLRDLPDLFDPERPHLRVLALEAETVDRRPGQVSLRALGEDGHLADQVAARLELRQRLAVLAAAAVARAHTAHAPVGDEQLLARGLGQDRRAAFLRLLRQPAAELRQGGHEVAVVPHRRRRRDPQRVLPRQVVDRLVRDMAVERHLRDALALSEQLLQGGRVDDRAREQMRTGLRALVDHGDRNLAEPLADGRGRLEQLAEPDRAREPGGPGADDEHSDLDRIGVGGCGDHLGRVERRRVLGRAHVTLSGRGRAR